jgi:hypothetical protein
MADPIVLYSASTWLAYVVAERYYSNEHYVWCTPYFDSRSLPDIDAATPPSSTPSEIYHSLDAEVRAGDRHSAKIELNRVGILKGASFKLHAGTISEKQAKDITAIVEGAETRDFRPLLYVIPYQPVAGILKMVPVAERAHPLSVEYVIEGLPRHCFDVIELNRR